jgi:hypothetical protein
VKWANDLINFYTHGCRRRWSDQVCDALRDAHPGLLPDDDGTDTLWNGEGAP